MEQPRIVGHVVSVNGFRVKVELSSEVRSSSRATPDGTHRAISINSFLTFDLGAGTHAIGILSGLDARESFDPSRDSELALELMKPRRIALVELLGSVTLGNDNVWKFDPAINILPTLDTRAEIATQDVLKGIFGYPPLRNRPKEFPSSDFDCPLDIGYHTVDGHTRVKASFNDLFSRPLAIVGNTGSGKSYTISSLVNGIISNQKIPENTTDRHIFILDVNGEYSSSLLNEKNSYYIRKPNRMYLNGEEFCLPVWLLNVEEICDWMQASEATQEPVLKDWWSIAKSRVHEPDESKNLQLAMVRINEAIKWLDEPKKPPTNTSFALYIKHISQYAPHIISDAENFLATEIEWTSADPQWAKILNDKEIRELLFEIRDKIRSELAKTLKNETYISRSADSPIYIPLEELRDPNLTLHPGDSDSDGRIEQYITTLRLRMRSRFEDRRWRPLFCYDEQNILCFKDWINRLGIGVKSNSRISIIDLSMISSETVPFICSVMGRILLDTREFVDPSTRNKNPWLLVLEEAHNYIRPHITSEDRKMRLSRNTFERIAKEGRKFGLSLIISSQRPSEISPTIISQCANFIAHRLQNPDDIDHFRRIIPRQAQRLLDQITILGSGEAIIFGSSLHIPARVQIKKPVREPSSMTSSPYIDWKNSPPFPIEHVLKNWGIE